MRMITCWNLWDLLIPNCSVVYACNTLMYREVQWRKLKYAHATENSFALVILFLELSFVSQKSNSKLKNFRITDENQKVLLDTTACFQNALRTN